MVYMLRVEQVFHLTKGTRVVIPGLMYSFLIQLIGGGSVKNFHGSLNWFSSRRDLFLGLWSVSRISIS